MCRTPERAWINTVRVEPQHLVVQLSRGRRGVGYAVEIADVLAGLFDDPGAVIVFGPLVPRDHRCRGQRLDCIEGGNSVEARFWIGLGKIQVHVVVGGVTRNNQAA